MLIVVSCLFLLLPLEKLTILLQFGKHLSKLGLKHCLLGVLLQQSLSEHVITPYSGPQHYSECCDNFNFLSQLWIWIEMVFGMLVTKWCIINTPIKVNLYNMKNCCVAALDYTIFVLRTENQQCSLNTSTKSNRSIFIHMSQMYWGMFQVMLMHQT